MHSTRKKRTPLFLFAAITLLLACGPFFPEELLLEPETALFAAPIADYRVALKLILPRSTVSFHAVAGKRLEWQLGPQLDSTDADADELADVLRDAAALSPLEQWRLVKRYREARIFARQKATAPTLPIFSPWNGIVPTVPENLPDEFADYLEGILAMHRNEPQAAMMAWLRLLQRPPSERKHRTLWATYMLGNIHREDRADGVVAQDAAIDWYRKTRELAMTGQFADREGLAAASLGWEAAIELHRHHFDRATELYLEQQSTGDDQACTSLMALSRSALASNDGVLALAASDEHTREVIDIYLLSLAGGYRSVDKLPDAPLFARWLKALEKQQIVGDPIADQIGWIAYRANDMTAAQRWADCAPAESTSANWLRAKLALRNGNPQAAAKLLAGVVESLPKSNDWQESLIDPDTFENSDYDNPKPAALCAMGELAILKVASSRYVEAMDLLLNAGYQTDAFYLAERVVTVDELRNYVDRMPENELALPSRRSGFHPPSKKVLLGNLLGRRLMRLGKDEIARRYFHDEVVSTFDDFERAVHTANDNSFSTAARGRAWWLAASIMRTQGLDLVGTELEPDFEIYDGSFGWRGEVAMRRLAVQSPHPFALPTTDEVDRVGANTPPRFRWHYRYLAAEFAWKAATLLPDEREETAKILRDAGNWLKDRDPAAAEPFYQALISRCAKTKTGKQAIAKGWLP